MFWNEYFCGTLQFHFALFFKNSVHVIRTKDILEHKGECEIQSSFGSFVDLLGERSKFAWGNRLDWGREMQRERERRLLKGIKDRGYEDYIVTCEIKYLVEKEEY